MIALCLAATGLAAGSAAQDTSLPEPGQDVETLGAGAPAIPLAATMLRMRDGSIRWGEIVAHDPDGLNFRLLAHGGEVRLGWDMLDPAEENELRELFGYVDVASEELMIIADSLVLNDGRTVTGVIIDREGPNFLVKVDGNLQAVPKRRVASLTSGQLMPALDVYSREELYGQYLANLDETDAASHVELARLCERILDFSAASTHYAAALELGVPTDEEEALRFAATRAGTKAKQQEQIDFLRETDTLRKRGQFDEALLRLAGFPQAFPGSPLVQDAAEKLLRTEQLRDEAARKLVQRRWTYWAKRIARVAQKELSLQAAESYATGQLTEEIQKRVHADVVKNISTAIPLEAIGEYWATRRKGRFASTSYGKATWLLGPERARAGATDEKKEEKREKETALDRERVEFEKKLKRFLDNQQRAAQRRGGADDAEEAAEFWSTISGSSRASWLFAFYVEFGGAYELSARPRTPNCTTCGGTGGREVVAIGGGGGGNDRSGGSGGRRGGGSNTVTSGLDIVECPTCHGVAVTRRLYYR